MRFHPINIQKLIDHLICTKPGNFNYGKEPMPELLPDHTLLRIRRIGICGTDLHAYDGTQPFFTYPRILGHELAGDVVAVSGESELVPGDRATLIPYIHCGDCVACRAGKTNCCARIRVCGVHTDGGMREYFQVPTHLMLAGGDLSYDELALVEPLAIGAHGMRRAMVEAGDFVLVMGAGPIGLAAMEFARIAGGKVIAVDVNDARLQFCQQQLGVAFTLNALNPEVVEQVKAITNGDMCQVVIDATGNLRAINNGIHYLSHGGRYVLIGLQKADFSFNHPEFHKRESTLMSSRNATRTDFDWVIQSITQKQIDPNKFITHRLGFFEVKERFESLSKPETGVIKAMIEL